MTNNPKITIAIPVYNAGKYIKASLQSAIEQTFKDYEILIVDNASTDNTISIVEEVMQSNVDKNIRIIRHPQNLGLGASKNTAIDNAKGEYLYFMDADDEIFDYTLERLYAAAQKYRGVEMVVGSIQVEIDGILHHTKLSKNSHVEKDFAADIPTFYTPDWNKLYLLSFLKTNNIRCIPKHLHEDVWFTFQIICIAKNVVFCNDITYRYLVRNDSVCLTENNELTAKAVEEWLEICEYEYNYIMNEKEYDNIHNKTMFLTLYSNLICKILCWQSDEKSRYLSALKKYKKAVSLKEINKLPIRLRTFVAGLHLLPFCINCVLYNYLRINVFERKWR